MQENDIKKVIEGISYSKDARERILSGISQKQTDMQSIGVWKNGRRWGISGKLKAVVVLACLVLAVVIANAGNSGPYGAQVSVYAKTSEGEKEQVVLSQGEKVELEQTQTPVGDGYTFQISMEDDNAYYTATIYADEESFEIYQDGTYFYCVTVSDDDTDTSAEDAPGNDDDIAGDDNSEGDADLIEAGIPGGDVDMTIFTDSSKMSRMDVITDAEGDNNVKYILYSDDIDKDTGTIEVTIYNREGEVLEKKAIQFERLDDGSMTFVWD